MSYGFFFKVDIITLKRALNVSIPSICDRPSVENVSIVINSALIFSNLCAIIRIQVHWVMYSYLLQKLLNFPNMYISEKSNGLSLGELASRALVCWKHC